MDMMIDFTAGAAQGEEKAGRHLAATTAMRRYVPHVVAWRCPAVGAPFSVTLPASLSARELVGRAARERVHLATADDPTAPDRVVEIHYAHLAEAEIEEGIRRLGHCLARYSEMAARHMPGHPSTLVGS